jgi:transcriptional regulator with GAF, ATPase, and Fis domain
MRDEEKTKERLIEELRALRGGSVPPLAYEKKFEVESRHLEADRQRALQELDHGMRSAADLQELYRAFARHTLPILRYYRTSILLLEHGRSIVAYLSDDQGDSGNVTIGSTIANEGSSAAWVIEQDEPILREMNQKDVLSVEDEQMLGSGMVSCMIVPLRARGRVIGAWLVSSRRAGAYDRDDLATAQSLADSLATQIEIHWLNPE